MLRVLLGVNLLSLIAALVQSEGMSDALQRYGDMAAWVQPLLLGNLSLLALFAREFPRVPLWIGRLLVVSLSALSSMAWFAFLVFLTFDSVNGQRLLRAGILGALTAGTMLSYFTWRSGVLSPALVEARLQALTARIRPHFLFNSLNAVLSLIRLDPRRAETALEELAELFRALMRDHREWVPLREEIALCRQYLDLEKLRLGDRLNIEWQVIDVPYDRPVPPLLIQPLLENAVYHGVEPLSEPATIQVRIIGGRDELRIEVANPCGDVVAHQRGNRMALENIRERLALYYDLEARLETCDVSVTGGRREYRVRIVLPNRERLP